MLIARREGQATEEGPLAGAAVTEYGMHDIAPGVGGTGGLANLIGAGTMHIRAVSPTDRRFILQGEVARRR